VVGKGMGPSVPAVVQRGLSRAHTVIYTHIHTPMFTHFTNSHTQVNPPKHSHAPAISIITTHTHAHTHTYIHTHTYTHSLTHTHTHTHTHTPVCRNVGYTMPCSSTASKKLARMPSLRFANFLFTP